MRASLICLPLLLPAVSLAGVLSGDRVAVGVNSDGSLVDDADTVGIIYDPVNAPIGADLLTPGRSFEAFGLRYQRDDTWVEHTSQGPYRGGGMPFEWQDVQHNGVFTWQEGTADLGDVLVHLSVDLPVNDEVFWVNVTVTAVRSVSNLRVVRAVDSDPDYFIDRSYRTHNITGAGYGVSSSLREQGKALALGLDGGSAGICSWCATVNAVLEAPGDDMDGDLVIGVVSESHTLQSDESVHLRFAYALATSQSEAVERIERAMMTTDMDGDGAGPQQGDCDDRDASVGPNAVERADGLDNDCDGAVDEDTVVSDDDDDGFSERDGDCDDADDRVHPNADPLEGVSDANCDGVADHDAFRDPDPPEGWGASDGQEVSAACDATTAPWSVMVWLLLPWCVRRRGER